jgi:hypothetical protein
VRFPRATRRFWMREVPVLLVIVDLLRVGITEWEGTSQVQATTTRVRPTGRGVAFAGRLAVVVDVRGAGVPAARCRCR